MTTIRIPPTLRTETGGERQVPARGDTVRELLPSALGLTVICTLLFAVFSNIEYRFVLARRSWPFTAMR